MFVRFIWFPAHDFGLDHFASQPFNSRPTFFPQKSCWSGNETTKASDFWIWIIVPCPIIWEWQHSWGLENISPLSLQKMCTEVSDYSSLQRSTVLNYDLKFSYNGQLSGLKSSINRTSYLAPFPGLLTSNVWLLAVEKALGINYRMRLKDGGDIAIYGISAHACSAWRLMGVV